MSSELAPACAFCGCQEFLYTPAADAAVDQLLHPPQALRCENCPHTFREHGDIPPMLECTQCTHCSRFRLGALGDRLSATTCVCTHPWAYHRRPSQNPPSTGRDTARSVPLPPNPIPTGAQPAPASSGGTGLLHSATARRFTTFNEMHGVSASGSTASANAQRTAAAKRHHKTGGLVPGGVVGRTRTAQPPPVRALRPPVISQSASSSSQSPAAIEPVVPLPPPPLKRTIIIFPADVTSLFTPRAPFPVLADLGLSPKFTIVKINPQLYTAFVDIMKELELVFQAEIPANASTPPRLLPAIMAAVEAHLSDRNIRLYPRSARTSAAPPFSLLKPGKAGNLVRFKQLVITPDVFSTKHLPKGIAGTSDVYIGTTAPSSFLLSDARLAQIRNVGLLTAPVVATPTPHHFCFMPHAIQVISQLDSNPVVLTPGLCAAICGPMLAAGATADVHHSDSQPDGEKRSPMDVDHAPLPSPPRAPASSLRPDQPARSPSPTVPPFFTPSPPPSTPSRVTPFRPAAVHPLQPPMSPDFSGLPDEAARLFRQLTAFTHAPYTPATALHLAVSPTPPPPDRLSPPAPSPDAIVISSDEDEQPVPARHGSVPLRQLQSSAPDVEEELPPSTPQTYLRWSTHYRSFIDILEAELQQYVPSEDVYFRYLFPYDKPTLGYVVSSILVTLANSLPRVDVANNQLCAQLVKEME
ncbi:hypothetical protein AURDEDRAFT_178322, partial [Auricularia subglabra TFB-10046 SS5]